MSGYSLGGLPMPVLTTRGMVSTRTSLPSVSVPLRTIPLRMSPSLITRLSEPVTLTVPTESEETQGVPSALTSWT